MTCDCWNALKRQNWLRISQSRRHRVSGYQVESKYTHLYGLLVICSGRPLLQICLLPRCPGAWTWINCFDYKHSASQRGWPSSSTLWAHLEQVEICRYPLLNRLKMRDTGYSYHNIGARKSWTFYTSPTISVAEETRREELRQEDGYPRAPGETHRDVTHYKDRYPGKTAKIWNVWWQIVDEELSLIDRGGLEETRRQVVQLSAYMAPTEENEFT